LEIKELIHVSQYLLAIYVRGQAQACHMLAIQTLNLVGSEIEPQKVGKELEALAAGNGSGLPPYAEQAFRDVIAGCTLSLQFDLPNEMTGLKALELRIDELRTDPGGSRYLRRGCGAWHLSDGVQDFPCLVRQFIEAAHEILAQFLQQHA
jgi:hypothetical protein